MSNGRRIYVVRSDPNPDPVGEKSGWRDPYFKMVRQYRSLQRVYYSTRSAYLKNDERMESHSYKLRDITLESRNEYTDVA